MNNKFLIITAVVVAGIFAVSVPAYSVDLDKTGGVSADTSKGMGQAWMKDLNLTPKQDADLKKSRADMAAKMTAARDTIKVKKAELKAEIDKTPINKGKIDSIVNEIKKLTNQMIDIRLDSVLSLKSILTPEQYKKIQDKMEKRRADNVVKPKPAATPASAPAKEVKKGK